MVLLTMQFSQAFRSFLPAALSLEPVAIAVENLSGAFLTGPFSQSPWRHAGGVLPDVGPHVVDAMTSVLGPAESARAQSQRGMVRLSLRHAAGGFSHAVLSAHHTGPPRHQLRAYGPTGVLDCDWSIADRIAGGPCVASSPRRCGRARPTPVTSAEAWRSSACSRP
jgi:predicted dehydrogenase